MGCKIGIIFLYFVHTISERTVLQMKEKKKITTTPGDQSPANTYDDGNIPKVDLPQDIIPDEVPRKDGPGGEGGK